MKRRTAIVSGLVLVAGLVGVGAATMTRSDEPVRLSMGLSSIWTTPRLTLPPRPDDAPRGRQILEAIRDLDLDARESRLVHEILSGNVPPFLRELVPVEVRPPDAEPTMVWVTSDYLSVGDDHDYLRVRLRAPAAQRVVRELGAVLPTPSIVDAVHRAAVVKLPPQATRALPHIDWVKQAEADDRRIDQLLADRDVKPGTLVAGHMKDLVITPALRHEPGKIAIYGLHEPNGRPIQPLSTIHGLDYVDYSQGIRPVADQIWRAGHRTSLSALLQSPKRAGAVSFRGPVDLPAYPRR